MKKNLFKKFTVLFTAFLMIFSLMLTTTPIKTNAT